MFSFLQKLNPFKKSEEPNWLKCPHCNVWSKYYTDPTMKVVAHTIHTTYIKCSLCQVISEWDFNIAPCAIFLGMSEMDETQIKLIHS